MSGALFYTPKFRPVDSSGHPMPGASLYFYEYGTAVLASVYTDPDLTIPSVNPLTADSGGEFNAVWLDPSLRYTVALQNAAGVTQWTITDYRASGSSGSGSTGPQGNDGMSVAEVACYIRSATTPDQPTGGSYNFATQSLSAPVGWSPEIPDGDDPCWTSRAVAAVIGTSGTDSVLLWSAPVLAFSDGSSVDIIFKRNAGQPATPAPSTGTPAGWYSDVDSVPASSDTLWSSVGTRDNGGQPWIWQLPIQVEGDAGPTGADAVLYYIKPTNGTAIKNSTGSLTLEAHRVVGGNDTILSSGSIKLYVGSTLVTVANGYATGSDGYTGVFDSGDISGAVTVTLKDGPSGTALDTITIVDVADGTADTGKNAVYGYIEATGGLAWVRGSDQTTWTPSATTTQLDCTFVQGGADVARVAWVVTRDSSGILTGASGTHTSGDLNGSRVTVTELHEGTQAFTVKFAYSYTGDVASVAETVITSLAGAAGATGGTGATGPGGLWMSVTKRSIPVMAYQSGTVVSFADANGQVAIYSGTTDVTASATINAVVAVNCTGTCNTALNTPVTGAKGYYRVTALTADTATLTLSATYGGNTATEVVSIYKSYVGYEIVTSLPVTNLFQGRIVFLTTDNKLYRYTGTAWTREVDGADLKVNSVTTNSVNAGAITAAKISVTDLSSLSANIGTVTAGIVQSNTGGSKFDLTNARVIFNTAPGSTGGYVRVQGYGFGPSNQYIDWYGPKPAGQITDAAIVAALSDSAALYFLKTDGTGMSGQRQRGEFEVKAWCSLDGTGTPTLRDRFNVSSVARVPAQPTGAYRITFAEPLANANYSAVISGAGGKLLVFNIYAQTTTYVDITSWRVSDRSIYDADIFNVVIFGSNVVGSTNVASPSGGVGGGTRGFGNLPGSSFL